MPHPSKPISVLMVCLGNICRSPLAEGILKEEVRRLNLSERFHIDSAGTSSEHTGELADPRSRKIAEQKGFTLTHRARPFTATDFNHFDWILVMDESNFRNVTRLAKTDTEKARVKLISEFDLQKTWGREVPDPYYGGLDGFVEVYEQLLTCIRGFLSQIQ